MLAAATGRGLPPPSAYEGRLSYAHQWKQLVVQNQHAEASAPSEAAASKQVIFDLTFVNQQQQGHEEEEEIVQYLVGCTGSGEVCIWRMPPPTTSSSSSSPMSSPSTPYQQTPICRFSVGSGASSQSASATLAKPCLYSIQIVPIDQDVVMTGENNSNQQQHWLVAAGDGGVWLYHWEQDIEPLLLNKNPDEQEQQQVSADVTPKCHLPLHPSACESAVEVNDVCWHDGHLYGAAGDAFGCYKWNVERQELVTTYRPSSLLAVAAASSNIKKRPPTAGNYMQSVCHVPHTNLLLTGGHDGLLGIWDMEKDQAVDCLDVAAAIDGFSNITATMTTTTTANSNPQSRRRAASPTPSLHQQSSPHVWISSIVARDENWWTIAGGRSNNNSSITTTTSSSSQQQHTKNGFVATWHGPTRSLVSRVETRERPQKLALYGEQVLGVANESFVTHYHDSWSLSSSNNNNKVWCNAPSAYAVEVAPDGQRIAAAGVGGIVSLYEDQTQLTGTLCLSSR